MIAHIYRVAYGKDNVPLNEREYTICRGFGGAVGTVAEFLNIIKNPSCTRLVCLDKNGINQEQVWVKTNGEWNQEIIKGGETNG